MYSQSISSSTNQLQDQSNERDINNYISRFQKSLYRLDLHKFEQSTLYQNTYGKQARHSLKKQVTTTGIDKEDKEPLNMTQEKYIKEPEYNKYTTDRRLAQQLDHPKYLLYEYNDHQYPIKHIRIIQNSPTDIQIITGDLKGNIYIFDLVQGHVTKKHKLLNPLYDLYISQDGKFIISGGQQDSIDVYSLENFIVVQRANLQAWPEKVTISNRNQYIACSLLSYSVKGDLINDKYSILIYQFGHMNQPPKILRGHTDKVLQIEFNPQNNNILASISKDKKIIVWDHQNTKNFNLHQQDQNITCMSFSPNGSQLMVGTTVGDIQVYEIYDNNIQFSQKIYAHTKNVSDIIFSTQSSAFVSSGYDQQIKLWDVGIQSGFEDVITIYHGHDEKIDQLCVDGTANLFISIDQKQNVRIWSQIKEQLEEQFTRQKQVSTSQYNSRNTRHSNTTIANSTININNMTTQQSQIMFKQAQSRYF